MLVEQVEHWSPLESCALPKSLKVKELGPEHMAAVAGRNPVVERSLVVEHTCLDALA